MDEESLVQRVLHLRQVEKLSQRQIALALGIGRKRIRQILNEVNVTTKRIYKESILDKFTNLIAQWYKQHPQLRAMQVFERLKSYGYTGGYSSVIRVTQSYRHRKAEAFHPLIFLPGQEAQVDWLFFQHEKLGQVAGFVYILSYSRYAWGMFYPKTSFEFFIDGHLQCFKHIQGLAHSHRYDNLKSVIIKREPVMEYNAQFLDFARFFGFSIYVCNPYSGNEKGRVERLIKDIRIFLYGETFLNLADLNNKFHFWLNKRNEAIHRVTGKSPKELLIQERLITPPKQDYLARRVIQAVVSKTALVEFETNKYSVPSSCVNKTVELLAYPDRIEIAFKANTVARHKRCFGKNQMIQNPLHSEKLLDVTPKFKMRRIEQLIAYMDESFNNFLLHQEDDTSRQKVAYELFCLLRVHSKVMIVSAVRQLNSMRSYKIKTLRSLLSLPEPKEGQNLWPQDNSLLNLEYQQRSLTDYDKLI